jgi:NitT/TauT family transport system substrate-binding protein
MVAATLRSLDGVAREACIQRYLLGRPYREISLALGVPVGTIKRRLHDARQKMIRAFAAQTEPVLHVGYLPVSDHLLGMVSHCINRGRLRIHLKRFLSWAGLAAALENGTLDAAFIMAPLALALRNRGVPIAYVMDAHHEGSAITVRRDLSTCQPARWNRVGMPYAISTHRILLAGMLEVGPAPATAGITPQYRGPSYLVNALERRDIDAFACAEPWNTKAEAEGSGRIVARSRDFLPGHICCILVVREELIETRGEWVREYLKLLLSAYDFIAADWGRSAEIQARYTGVSADIIRHVLREGQISFEDIIPDRGRIESLMHLALRAGILDRPCNLDRFLRTDIL